MKRGVSLAFGIFVVLVLLSVVSAPMPARAAGQPLSYDVLATWTTAQSDVGTLLHVRVHLAAQRTVVVRSSAFQVVVTSPTGGKETVYGYDQQAPNVARAPRPLNFLATQAPDAPTVTPAIDAREDLGRAPVTMHAGDVISMVVTFLVRRDAVLDRSDPGSIRLIVSRLGK